MKHPVLGLFVGETVVAVTGRLDSYATHILSGVLDAEGRVDGFDVDFVGLDGRWFDMTTGTFVIEGVPLLVHDG